MTLVFTVDHGRVSDVKEAVADLAGWKALAVRINAEQGSVSK